MSPEPTSPAHRPGGGFTERVKQELARTPLDDLHDQRAELAALLRFAGAVHLHAGATPEARLSIETVTTSGAVARRAFTLLQHLYHVRPELRVRAPGGVRRQRTYAVIVAAEAGRIGRDTGVLDEAGRPQGELPLTIVERRGAAVAYLRGAVLATGSINAPGRTPHLEIAASSDRSAEQLAALGRRTLRRTVTAVPGERPRVVVKSGEAIGELLTVIGATQAFLSWDEQRLRRSLRNQANRLANADAANLRRTIEAAAAQTRAVEAVIEQVGWEALDPDLRDVALARLANPAASLAELGELCDPPVGKSSVHRRLRRLLALTHPGTPDR